MNLINKIKEDILEAFKKIFLIDNSQLYKIKIYLNLDKSHKNFGDLSCNAPMILAKKEQQNPRFIAQKFIKEFEQDFAFKKMSVFISNIQVAGPGFLNFTFTTKAWQKLAKELFLERDNFFKLDEHQKRLTYLIEFVSANPTGPLHLGHGRGAVIGSVLSNVLIFLGHDVKTEFYINDAGNQMQKLGNSFKIRCLQSIGEDIDLPEDGYHGEYLIDLADKCVKEYGSNIKNRDELFFINYAKEHMLEMQKKDLADYGIKFNNWFSEKTLHESGQVEQVIKDLHEKNLVYEKDGALWFKSTKFGDDKDRVIKKSTGEFTYIAADIAYHKNKFERGFNKVVDILGQDHHGYVKRLKSTIQALGYDSKNLNIILYQLVSLKNASKIERMSKRSGKFTTLREVIDAVGRDVARFFYLNRKAEAHLDFDLSIALKRTEENPVFYIQYAYVRTRGIFQKALSVDLLNSFVQNIIDNALTQGQIDDLLNFLGTNEFDMIKKMISLQDILFVIADNYQTHLLAYYLFEFANYFHTYYANNRIIDESNIEQSKARLFILSLIRYILGLGLDLLELSKPKHM